MKLIRQTYHDTCSYILWIDVEITFADSFDTSASQPEGAYD